MSLSRKILRRRQVIEKVGLSRSTIDRQEAANQFPKRVPLGENSIGWFEDEIDAHLEARRVKPSSSVTA
jgi:prophage regulatory protein